LAFRQKKEGTGRQTNKPDVVQKGFLKRKERKAEQTVRFYDDDTSNRFAFHDA